jgi:phosphate transport system substrate-binding protein
VTSRIGRASLGFQCEAFFAVARAENVMLMKRASKRAIGPAGPFLITVVTLLIGIAGLLSQAACVGGRAPDIRFQGAGATFPNPIYKEWFAAYTAVHPNVKFDYQAIGSGGGIKQIIARTVDFGGSDAPMSDAELASAGDPIIHIPTVIGAIVLTYNLPGITSSLNLTPEAVAAIYLGGIKRWNDPAIAASNKSLPLPDTEIQVVHRSDGSGTSFAFTDYLSKVSAEWNRGYGAKTSPNWPVGAAAKGNDGVARQVTQTPSSIGYVELIFAEQNKLPYASIKNSAGEYVQPSLDSIQAAAATVQMPDDLRVSITNAPGTSAYPISSFTYLLVYKQQPDRTRGKALLDFLWWATHDGQQMVRALSYSPLPKEVVELVERKIKLMSFQDKPLHGA